MNSDRGRILGYWREAVGAVVVLVSRILTMPRTPWEYDEFLFAGAVRNFDPYSDHPHAPGYPLYVLLGKVFHAFVGDPWRALVILAVVAAPVGFVALSLAFRRWIGDADLAAAGALLYYFSASMLVHGTLALSDGTAMMFVALAFFALSHLEDAQHDRTAIALGIWSSAAIGCRPQLLIPFAPLLLVALWRMRSMRQRVACVIAFVIVSVMWFLPLLDAAGGWEKLLAYEHKQAAVFATYDAALSRGAKGAAAIATRFLLHPWGSKYVTIPLLLAFALGIPLLVYRWRPLLPLIIFTAVQELFAIGWMDPADAARYSLPSMIFFALVAACGFDVVRRSAQIRAIPWVGAAILAALSIWDSGPLLAERTRGPAPASAAADYVDRNFAPNTVILYELAVRPHAEALMRRFRPMDVERGLAAFYDHPEVPLVLFADGGSRSPSAKVFAWPLSDAYGKLTRNHYRVVALEPIPPEERYLPLRGVYRPERTAGGEEWRWLAPSAAIRLPTAHGDHVTVALLLSPDTPYDKNVIHISVNARPAGEIIVGKKTAQSATLPLPAGPVEIAFHAEQSFAPARVLRNRDPRVLAAQLVAVTQH